MDCEASMHDLLQRMLLDASIKPTDMPLAVLKAITDNFSDDKQIGKGGFAIVYKGQLQNGTIAVKKLSQTLEVDENKFIQEVVNLMKVKHKNIVRFLGYCADTQGKMLNHDGKNVLAEERERLLCFEFLPKGSLDKYITDASHGPEWRIRYQIIKGICEGLHYLHQNNIVHLDLKPANILLTDNMEPKIADFGLSRCFDENQSRAMTSKVAGSLGYLAPESYSGVITFKLDIYSLGVIIMEILTGQKGYSEIENVRESWSNRFETSNHDTQSNQVRVCAEIGVECTNFNPAKRPATRHIIETLDEMERAYGFIETDLCTSSATHEKEGSTELQQGKRKVPSETSTELSSDSVQLLGVDLGNLQFTSEVRSLGSSKTSNLLDIHPRELRFPFKPNELITCPVSLTNRTDRYLAVWITPTNPEEDIYNPLKCSLIHPHSTWVVAMKMKERQQPPRREMEKFEVLMIAFGSEDDIRDLKSSFGNSDNGLSMSSDFWKRIEELGGEVHFDMLTAVICDPGSREAGKNKIISRGQLGGVFSMDVHPTQTWIITGHEGGFVSILNYQAQEREMALQVTKESTFPVYSVKFIAERKWLATGDGHGCVKVYTYTTTTKSVIKKIRAHGGKPVTSLAVHPSYPYLLTSSQYDNSIELWDWEQGWSCARTFDGHTDGVGSITFNRWDIDSFASVGYGDGKAKVWNTDSSEPISTVVGHGRADYLCTGSPRHFLVASHSPCAYIWDLQREEPIHKLGGRGLTVCDVASHPTLPILATSSRDGTVCLWDAGTYRLEKIVQLPPLGEFVDLALIGTEGLTRLVVGCTDGIAIMEINLPMASSVSKLAREVQSTDASAPPLDSTSSSSEMDCDETTIKVVDVHSLEFCFPFKPNKCHRYPVTFTNMTDYCVGAWITPIGANSWVNQSLEDPCSFFFMKPNSTWVATVTTMKEQQQLPSRDTCKFEMTMIVMGSEHDLPNLDSPHNGSEPSMGGDLLKLVESGGKLPLAMLTAAIYQPANCKIMTTHETTSAREYGKIFSMDVHPTEPWILAGHKGGFVSIWNYQTQQRAKAFRASSCSVCSVKFIVRDQWLAVAAGDVNGWVHVINACFEMNKVRTFEAHPDKRVDSMAVHPSYPKLLSSSREDSRIMLWDWDQGWVCTQIFQGHTWGVRSLAFNPRDIDSFASVGMDHDAKVWKINSNDIAPSVELEKVDYFFTDRHRHFMIYCDNDEIKNSEIRDLQTKDHLQTLGVFMRRNLHKDDDFLGLPGLCKDDNEVGVKGRDGGNNSGKKGGCGNEILGQIKDKAKNNGKRETGAKQKQNHGGRGDHTNNASGEGAPGTSNHQQAGITRPNMMMIDGAGYPAMGQMAGGRTSMPMGHPNMSGMPAAGLSPRDNIFSDENPNSCSVM